MTDFARPKVVCSRCIEFDACRYDNHFISSDFVKALKPFVDFKPVCPECEIGLGVPRKPIRIVEGKGQRRLVQPATGLDVSENMARFSESFLNSLTRVDGFILKFRSPSCGLKDVKVYPSGGNMAASRGPGFFGAAVLRKFPDLAVENEGRLRNLRIRDHFVTKLYVLAAFREARVRGDASDLLGFHTNNKYLLMAYNQNEAKFLGNVMANHEKMNLDRVMTYYQSHLASALSKPPRCTSNINVLTHIMGHFSDDLRPEERSFFLRTLESYREKRTPLSAAKTVLKGWVARFDDDYLRQQTFLDPYPEELVELCSHGP